MTVEEAEGQARLRSVEKALPGQQRAPLLDEGIASLQTDRDGLSAETPEGGSSPGVRVEGTISILQRLEKFSSGRAERAEGFQHERNEAGFLVLGERRELSHFFSHTKVSSTEASLRPLEVGRTVGVGDGDVKHELSKRREHQEVRSLVEVDPRLDVNDRACHADQSSQELDQQIVSLCACRCGKVGARQKVVTIAGEVTSTSAMRGHEVHGWDAQA